MRHCRQPAMQGCVMAPGLLPVRAREEEDGGISSVLCSNASKTCNKETSNISTGKEIS
jgi:hypothetical protein